jgi:hypothetical protein
MYETWKDQNLLNYIFFRKIFYFFKAPSSLFVLFLSLLYLSTATTFALQSF